jgi:hypothetical protein
MVLPTYLVPSFFFPWHYFLVRFWAFIGLRQEESKNTTEMFSQKIVFFSSQGASSVFGFISFSGASQRREFKNTTKKIAKK